MRNVPEGIKTCGIPSEGEVRSVDAVGVDISGDSVIAVAVGRNVSEVAEGSMVVVAVGGICVDAGSAAGTCTPVQALSTKNRMKVVMMCFMDQLCGV